MSTFIFIYSIPDGENFNQYIQHTLKHIYISFKVCYGTYERMENNIQNIWKTKLKIAASNVKF